MGSIFPDNFDYEIEKSMCNGDIFEAVVRVKCKTGDEIMEWKSALEEKSKSRWIVRYTLPNTTKFHFRRHYVCHRGLSHKAVEPGKNYCNARMTVTVREYFHLVAV